MPASMSSNFGRRELRQQRRERLRRAPARRIPDEGEQRTATPEAHGGDLARSEELPEAADDGRLRHRFRQ